MQSASAKIRSLATRCSTNGAGFRRIMQCSLWSVRRVIPDCREAADRESRTRSDGLRGFPVRPSSAENNRDEDDRANGGSCDKPSGARVEIEASRRGFGWGRAGALAPGRRTPRDSVERASQPRRHGVPRREGDAALRFGVAGRCERRADEMDHGAIGSNPNHDRQPRRSDPVKKSNSRVSRRDAGFRRKTSGRHSEIRLGERSFTRPPPAMPPRTFSPSLRPPPRARRACRALRLCRSPPRRPCGRAPCAPG